MLVSSKRDFLLDHPIAKSQAIDDGMRCNGLRIKWSIPDPMGGPSL